MSSLRARARIYDCLKEKYPTLPILPTPKLGAGGVGSVGYFLVSLYIRAYNTRAHYAYMYSLSGK